MATPLALKNLSHNRVRTIIGMMGVGFAAVLMFMQLGFKGAIVRTATQIYDALEFDLLVRSPDYLHLTEARTFPRQRLWQATSVEGVASARPLNVSLSEWQTPGSSPIANNPDGIYGQSRSIIALGVEPEDAPFARQDLCIAAKQLTNPRFVLIDTRSKAEYGPTNPPRFTEADIGLQTGLGGKRVEIVGLYELGAGMACNGSCMASLAGYRSACPWHGPDELSLGLIEISESANLAEVQQQLNQLMGDDAQVLTLDEVRAGEERRWMVETPFGKIFNLGVVVAVFVGIAIVYQVLSSDIANMMSEYATLKAIGYSNRYLATIVLQQSILLAIVGYLPSLALATLLYLAIGNQAGIPMVMTPQVMLTVFLLTLTMCIVSGIAAMQKLFSADPADLF